jgi:hypothetical protein
VHKKGLKRYLKRQRDRSLEKYRSYVTIYDNSKTGRILTNSHMTDEAVYVLYFSHKPLTLNWHKQAPHPSHLPIDRFTFKTMVKTVLRLVILIEDISHFSHLFLLFYVYCPAAAISDSSPCRPPPAPAPRTPGSDLRQLFHLSPVPTLPSIGPSVCT